MMFSGRDRRQRVRMRGGALDSVGRFRSVRLEGLPIGREGAIEVPFEVG